MENTLPNPIVRCRPKTDSNIGTRNTKPKQDTHDQETVNAMVHRAAAIQKI
jgi:hypothetical protein